VPLAGLHQAGLEAYLLPYRTGLRRRCRLRHPDGRPVPVIAIGNLASGGTGKTPMTVLVARRLHGEGRRVVVLSRGHGGARTAGDGPRVVSDGERVLLGPDEAGDEPALLARLLPGVPVVVGRDRRRSGRLAVERWAPDVVVLDDALQFWQLARDLDIVLLDARRPFDNGYVLPRGLLREPPRHLARAGIVVLTRADLVSPDALDAARARVRALAPAAALFTAVHAPVAWLRVAGTGGGPDDTVTLPADALAGEDVAAFAGIADSGTFVHTVEALGARVVHLEDFGDHHAYTPQDLLPIAAVPCGAVVTTEKDLVKVARFWPPEGAKMPPPPPLYALRIGMKLDDPAGFVERILRVAPAAAPPRGYQAAGRSPG
jgi:tetraacyldisaccharide 4'-kinase